MPAILQEVPWETRNLGRPSYQTSEAFLENPRAELLAQEIADAEASGGGIFVQARPAKGQMEAAAIFEETGFRFVEATLVPHTRFRSNKALAGFLQNKVIFVPRRYSVSNLTVDEDGDPSPEMRRHLRDMARSSFSDDRFHIDIRCPKDLADRRFEFWIDDLLANEGVVFDVLRLSDEPIAFMARKSENLILAGFRSDHTGSGLGDFMWLSTLASMQNKGLARADTLISANNTAVLNLYVRLGFKFREPGATFHFWSE